MLSGLLNSTTVPLLEQMAVFGERRHEVLTGNIANIDTPNYKMRDLPVEQFQRALREAIEQTNTGGKAASHPPSPAAAKSLDQLFARELFEAKDAPAENLTFHDANNRSIEHQVTEMTKNTMMQNFAVELMSAQMNMLQMVISERP